MTLRSLLPSRGGPPHVREATTEDAPALAAIHAGAFHRGWDAAEFERLLADRCAHAHVLQLGTRGAPQGFVLSHLVVPEAEILSIALAVPVRGKGYARILLDYHLGRLAFAGGRCSHLEVAADNEPALRLYRRAGYVEVGRRKGYYAGVQGAADALVMRRDF
ncbi:MAG: hypothetical protein B7Z45_09495 [Azorhizobium sp. 12-66-6]|nr:MAG: hypothetical protein B7Z45_09495 [Azorhizobium sp. 12-66-6]